MTEQEAVEVFGKMDAHDKVAIVAQECSKILIAAMIDSGLENYINAQMIDDKGNAYQLIFVRKPINNLEIK